MFAGRERKELNGEREGKEESKLDFSLGKAREAREHRSLAKAGWEVRRVPGAEATYFHEQQNMGEGLQMQHWFGHSD